MHLRTRLVVLAAGTVGLVGTGFAMNRSQAYAPPPQCGGVAPCTTLPRIEISELPTLPKLPPIDLKHPVTTIGCDPGPCPPTS